MSTEEGEEKRNRTVTKWRAFSFVLSILCIVLLVLIVALFFIRENPSPEIPVCHGVPDTGVNDLTEPSNPSLFHDITTKEINAIKDYLANKINATSIRSSSLKDKKAFIFDIDLHLPKKDNALRYLKEVVTKPEREAIVTIWHRDQDPPVVQEYKVRPSNKPHHLEKQGKPIPYVHRPILPREIEEVENELADMCDDIKLLLLESFGGTTKNCGDKCLVFKMRSIMSQQSTGINGVRKIWFWLTQAIESFVLNPVDFAILVDLTGADPVVEKVWYNSFDYDSLESLKTKYEEPGFVKLQVEFPNVLDEHFSRISMRGTKTPSLPQRPPVQIEPDGRRYTVKQQEVMYMNWKFNFRMSSVHGPQLYNIRFLDETIVFEFGLQEILVQYSGNIPTHKFSTHFGATEMIGWQAKGLVPSIDCPSSATFIDVTKLTESEPTKQKNAFCVFEHNTNSPLRRHRSTGTATGMFYEGLVKSVLILRSVISLFQSDYIIDFIFYLEGTIQVNVAITGLLMPTHFTGNNNPGNKYGFRIQQHIVGNIHQHFLNFKADVDVVGTTNSFQTLKATGEKVSNAYSNQPNAFWYQENMKVENIQRETENWFLMGTEERSYQLFLSGSEGSKEDNIRAYRMVNKGDLRSLTPPSKGIEPLVPWITSPLIITKRKDEEQYSSSKYAAFGISGANTNFSTYISNDESLVNQDLVAWITIGKHNIPHSEYLPSIHTAGTEFGFFLTPFHYFPSNPAMSSRDAVRYDLNKSPGDGKPSKVVSTHYTQTKSVKCVPGTSNYENKLKGDQSMLFDES